MKRIVLVMALVLSGCAESQLVAYGPQGGYIRNEGWNPLYGHYLPQKAAQQHCSRYGKTAVFEQTETGATADFKCV